MNDIIKFRAYDDGKMIYENDIKHIGLIDEPILRLAKFFCNIGNNAKLMRFTGMVDKTGKEIYEGDIVRFDVQEGRAGIEPAKINQIGIVTIGCVVNYGVWMCIWCTNTRIIGNKYLNPELWKQHCTSTSQ